MIKHLTSPIVTRPIDKRRRRTKARTRHVAALALTLLLATPLTSGQPSPASDHFERAQRYAVEQRLPEALIELKNALQIDDQNIPALLLFADLNARRGDVGIAEQAYSEALLLGASPGLVLPRLADTLLMQGAYQRLLEELPTVDLPPRARGEVLAYRAMASLQLGREIDSRVLLQQAEELAPGATAVRVAALEQALHDRALETAQALSADLVATDTPDARLWALRGRVLTLAGTPEQALAAYDRAIAVNPRLVSARLERARLNAGGGDALRALEDLGFLTETFPGDPRAHCLRGELLLNQAPSAGSDDASQAFASCANALSVFDDDVVAGSRDLTLIAVTAAINTGSPQQALQALTAFQSRHPGQRDTGLALAKLQLDANQPGEALRTIEPLLRAAPDDLQLKALQAQALGRSGRFDEAARLWKELRGRDDSPLIVSSLAASQLHSGDLSGGIANLEALLAEQPEAETERYQLSSAYLQIGRYQDAAQLAETLVADYPARWQYRLLKAQCLLLLGRSADAEQALREAIASLGDHDALQLALAQTLLEQGRLDASRDVLAALEANSEPTADTLVQGARVEMLAGDLSAAARLAEKALALDPASVGATRTLAEALQAGEKPDEALQAVRTLANRNPDLLPAQFLFAETLARQGRRDEALSQYKLLARRDTLPHQSLYRIAAAQADLRALDDASATLYRARRLAPQDRRYRVAEIDIALRLGHTRVSLEAAGTLAQDHPDDLAAIMTLARAQSAAGTHRAAAASYARARRLAPDNPRLCLAQYQALRRAGDDTAASRLLTEWLRTRPEEPLVGFARAGELLASGDNEAAAAQLQALLKDSPGNPVLLNNLAVAQTRLGAAEAVETARQALRHAPDSAEINDTLGWALTQSGQPEAALPYLREAVARSADDAEARYHLGMTLRALGRMAEARVELERAASANDPIAGEARQLLD